MSKSSTPQSTLLATIKRRRALPVASAAAISLAGCNMLPATPAASAPASTEQTAAAQRVKSFTSDIEIALDKVDRDRLRAAAEKKNPPAVAAPSTAAPVSVIPLAEAVPASPSVILASTTSENSSLSVTAISTGSPKAPATTGNVPGTVLATIPPIISAPVVSAPVVTPVRPVQVAVAESPKTGPVAPLVPSITSVAGNSSVITPLMPVATSPTAAMGSMTAMLATPLVTPAPTEEVLTSISKTPPPVVSPVAAEPTLEDALAIVRKNVNAHPTLATTLALSLLDASKTAEADPSKALPDTDQKVLNDLLTALDTMKTVTAAPNATIADRAAPLLDAAKKWQADADLTLPKLVLANRVDSFGVYSAVSPKFEQGKRHTVIIYCEVANFSSQKGDDGWFTTRLAQQETLITDDVRLVWRPNAEDIEDRSMNQRHDFYLVKKLTIPENLAAGKYTLRMSVTDHNTNKISLVSLPIEIEAK